MPVERPDPRDDHQLIASANAGDASAFESLYERYRDWVFSLARRFTRDQALANDVTQETFLYFLRKFPGFRLTAQLKTFLYPVVRHNALALRRKSHRLVNPHTADLNDAEAASPAEPFAQSEPLRALHRAVERLDVAHCEVIILRFVEELSLQEIAQAMEIPLGTVKSRLHHALAELRRDQSLQDFFRDS